MPLNLEARTLLDYMATIDAPPLDSQDPVTAYALAAQALAQAFRRR